STDNGREIATLSLPDLDITKASTSVALSPDGQRLWAKMSDPERIEVIDVSGKRAKAVIFTDGVDVRMPLVFSGDGQAVGLISYDGDIRVLDIAEGKMRHNCKIEGQIRAGALSPDGRLLVVSAGRIKSRMGQVIAGISARLAEKLFPEERTLLVDVQTGRVLESLPDCSYLAFSPDGKSLVTYSKKEDGVFTWDVPPRRRVPLFVCLLALGCAVTLTVTWWRAKKEEPARVLSTREKKKGEKGVRFI
ncbi:MAG TPA: hypothetical protein VFA15_09325, partial [Nitrososphaera sp.]|nr:hypothetical protein [Nitrososphaera sp.]